MWLIKEWSYKDLCIHAQYLCVVTTNWPLLTNWRAMYTIVYKRNQHFFRQWKATGSDCFTSREFRVFHVASNLLLWRIANTVNNISRYSEQSSMSHAIFEEMCLVTSLCVRSFKLNVRLLSRTYFHGSLGVCWISSGTLILVFSSLLLFIFSHPWKICCWYLRFRCNNKLCFWRREYAV